MAGDKTLKLSIWIAGHMDKSLTAAINSANGQISSLSRNISHMGTVGLAAMGTLAVGTAVALGKCTKEAESFEKSMADVVKYVDGLADTSGKISTDIWSEAVGGNGQTFQQNYQDMHTALLDLSTQIPMTVEDLAKLAAAAGQSGKSMKDLITETDGEVGGFLKDVAMVGTAMDITADQAGNWAAKWEKSLNMNHEQVMVLFDQINYLGANSATTAAEIADVVNSVASLGEVAGMDAASTAALADAMLAMGVDADVASTSISRMLVNMSKGESATKAQQQAWQELGLTASGVAADMQRVDENGNSLAANTLIDVLEKIGDIDADRQVAILNTLFGQWAIKGAAKLTGNLSTFTDALKMVSDPNLYSGSMEREFIIKASTSDAIDMMMKNAFHALKIDIGKQFLPVKKEFSLMMIDTMNGLRKNMPELSALATSAAKLLSDGVASAGKSLKNAMPYIQQALDYMVNNGDKVIKIIEGIGAAFLAMKFAPQIEGVVRGIGTLMTGKGGMGSLLAGGIGQEKGRKLGGLLGGVKNLFTGGQSAAAAGAGAISAFTGATRSNGLWATLSAALSSLISGNGILGTTGLLQAAASMPGLLSGYQSIGNILGGTRAGQFLGGMLSRTGGFIGGKITATKNGIGGLLNAATLPIRKVVEGSVVAKLAGNLLGRGTRLLGNFLGPVTGGFGSLLAGAAPVVAAISGIIAVVSILNGKFKILDTVFNKVFGEDGPEKLQMFKKTIIDLFQEGGVAKALSGVKKTLFGEFDDDEGWIGGILPDKRIFVQTYDSVVQIIQSVMGVIGQLVSFSETTVKPIIQRAFVFITQTVLPTILSAFTAAAPAISRIIYGIGSAVMAGMQMIGSAIQVAMPIIEGIIQIILQIGNFAIPLVLSAFSAFAQGIGELMTNIKGIFDGLISFITGVFTLNWQQAWEGIKQIFGNAFDALVTLCKIPINAVIAIINSAISGINRLGLTIPEWVPNIGGKSFSINIPEIPMLARGGFTTGPSIAGEAGREAVISFKASERARNISLWEQAGRMLGVDAVNLDEIERDGRGWGDYPGGESITFAPQITIQGNADASVMEQAIAEMRRLFETWYEEMQRRRARTAY